MTKKQKAEYEKYLQDKAQGRILNFDTIRFICQAYDFDATKIGQHFLRLLPEILKENVYGE